MIARLFRRWVDAAMEADNGRLRARVAELESRLEIQRLEIELLTAVHARNMARIHAETAVHACGIAAADAPAGKR